MLVDLVAVRAAGLGSRGPNHGAPPVAPQPQGSFPASIKKDGSREARPRAAARRRACGEGRPGVDFGEGSDLGPVGVVERRREAAELIHGLQRAAPAGIEGYLVLFMIIAVNRHLSQRKFRLNGAVAGYLVH